MRAAVDEINAHSLNSAAHHCGIQVERIGEAFVEASMPFDARTQGPDGTLRLGALAILAESVGSLAATISVDRDTYVALGQTLQLDYLNAPAAGPVRARARPISLNDDHQLWGIDVADAEGIPICSAKLRVVVLAKAELSQVRA